MVITGRILFQDDAVPFSRATVRVTVEDTTYADAPAEPIASWSSEDVSYPRDATGIRFDITLNQEPSPRRRYTLRALIDVDGDGRLGSGDYTNVAAVPLTDERPLEIRVKRLGS